MNWKWMKTVTAQGNEFKKKHVENSKFVRSAGSLSSWDSTSVSGTCLLRSTTWRAGCFIQISVTSRNDNFLLNDIYLDIYIIIIYTTVWLWRVSAEQRKGKEGICLEKEWIGFEEKEGKSIYTVNVGYCEIEGTEFLARYRRNSLLPTPAVEEFSLTEP